MTREQKIAAIYKEMANKDRTFWCLYVVKDREWNTYKVRETEWECVDLTYWSEYEVEYWNDMTETRYLESIIWHPVMIGDVLNWVNDKMWISNQEYEESIIEEANMAILLWGEYLKPIEEQSDECVDYIYSLISKNE